MQVPAAQTAQTAPDAHDVDLMLLLGHPVQVRHCCLNVAPVLHQHEICAQKDCHFNRRKEVNTILTLICNPGGDGERRRHDDVTLVEVREQLDLQSSNNCDSSYMTTARGFQCVCVLSIVGELV